MVAAIVEIIFIGLIVWAVNAFLPIPATFKNIVMFLGVLAVIMVLWGLFGGHPIVSVR